MSGLVCGYCRTRPAIDTGPCEECFDKRSPLWQEYHYGGGPLPPCLPAFLPGQEGEA